ncbi:MAG: alpha/beta fold hydrolase [Bacteroidia bacterium]
MRIKANGTKLYYKETKSNAGAKAVIFVHGFPFSHKMWDEQMEALPAEFKGIAYDGRGFGYSEVGELPYSIDLFADDLLALIEMLKLDKPIICGLSMGGYVALRAVEKDQSKIGGLVLCDTRSEGDNDEGKIKRFQAIEKIQKEGLDNYAADFVKNVFWEENLVKIPAKVEKIKRIIEDSSATAVGRTFLAMAARTDTSGKLSEIKLPTLIMVGEHDKLTPPIASQSMHEKIAHSQLEIIPDAAHMSNLENPEAFNKHLLSFLYKANIK